jgi:hypothetical protein
MKKSGLFVVFKIFLGVALLALQAGCAGFGRQWASAPLPSARDPFAGKWEGTWTSAKRPGEGGALRCVFTPFCGGRYEAAFHAHWKIFTSNYTAIFDTERHGRELRFHGTHEMPAIFGGEYHFEGRATPVSFTTSYRSSYDQGTFQLQRPPQSGAR